jgi:hypothetical protein
MVPMMQFSAGAMHTLWTYPCEAEVVVLQASACVFCFHCVHGGPVHQKSPIGEYHAPLGGVKETPDPKETVDVQPLFLYVQCDHGEYYGRQDLIEQDRWSCDEKVLLS